MPQLSSCIPCYAPTFSFTWCLLKLVLAPVACFNLFWHLMPRFNFLVQFLALDATLATCRVWSCHILTQEKQEAEDCSKEHLGLKSWKSGKPWIFAGHLEQERWSAESLDGKVCAPSSGDITCQSKQNCWKEWEKSPDACVEQQKRMRGGTAWLRQRKLFGCETHETPRTTEWNTVNFPNTWAFLKIVNHDRYFIIFHMYLWQSGWWFGTFFIFPYIGNNDPNWLIFFRGVAQPPTSVAHALRIFLGSSKCWTTEMAKSPWRLWWRKGLIDLIASDGFEELWSSTLLGWWS